MKAAAILLALAGVVYAASVWPPGARGGGGDGDAITVTVAPPDVQPPARLVPATYAGRTAKQWHDRYLAQLGRTHALKRTLLHQPTVTEALNLACAVYGDCATLWRRARCESKLDPGAVHDGRRYLLKANHAAGLLQFLPSTWRTTPFARLSVFSPYANALAAGWMIRAGRGGEWDCR